MTDPIRELLERQARWQSSRRSLSWEEKVRMIEEVRDSVLRFRDAPSESQDRMAEHVAETYARYGAVFERLANGPKRRS